jgi:8-oxo-dGTP diphosphatase
MIKYVLAFIFDTNNNIWLIEKQKPSWQKGKLNGIGGKIEEGETEDEAMYRELEEEAGVTDVQLFKVGEMIGNNNDDSDFYIAIYTGITDQVLKTMEDETISLFMCDLTGFEYNENVPSLIELCKYALHGKSNFSKFIMYY